MGLGDVPTFAKNTIQTVLTDDGMAVADRHRYRPAPEPGDNVAKGRSEVPGRAAYVIRLATPGNGFRTASLRFQEGSLP